MKPKLCVILLSTDRDSLSSSSDAEEDRSYAEPSEVKTQSLHAHTWGKQTQMCEQVWCDFTSQGQQDVDNVSPVVESAWESPESNRAEFTEKEAELSNDTHIPTRKNKVCMCVCVRSMFTLRICSLCDFYSSGLYFDFGFCSNSVSAYWKWFWRWVWWFWWDCWCFGSSQTKWNHFPSLRAKGNKLYNIGYIFKNKKNKQTKTYNANFDLLWVLNI